MAQNIESYLPGVRDNGGLATGEPATFASTVSVAGAATFSSSVTFATAPTFTGGQSFSSVSVATVATLTVAQSGSTILFTSSQGTVVKLPSPAVGLQYNFVVGTSLTGGTLGINSNSASVFLLGSMIAGTGTTAMFVANGISTVALGMNGTTTGGSSGTFFNVRCVTATQWLVTGQSIGSGILATPFL